MERLVPAAKGATPSGDEPTAPLAGLDSTPSVSRRSTGGTSTPLVFLGYVVVFLVFTLLRVHEIGKPMTFDVGNYQYYSGFGLLHGFRSPIALPGQLETYLDAQVNTLYYLLIAHLSPAVFVYLLASLQSLPVSMLALFVYVIGRRSTRSTKGPLLAGLVAGAAAFLAPLHIAEMGETSSDVLLAILVYLGAALLYRIVGAADWRPRWYWQAAGAGVLLGLAGELKFTEAAFSAAIVVAFAAALLVARRATGWGYGRIALLTGSVVLPALAVAAALYLPEGILLSQRYHDPLFPLLNGLFHSPYLLPRNFDPGYAANSISSLWYHFTRLVVGGQVGHNSNGLYLSALRSPLLFAALIVVAVAFVIDLVRRNRPEALFLEVSFLLGFLLWAILFGFYRYVAPLEMAAAAVLLLLAFLHRLYRPLLVIGAAVVVALAVPLSIYSVVGAREGFAGSYFGVTPGEFADLKGDGVVFAGGGTLAFLVPDLPADTELVRAGGNLDQVMSNAWWAHVRSVLAQNPRSRWVMFYGGQSTKVLATDLRQVGFPGDFHSCQLLNTEEDAVLAVHECQLDPPTTA